MKVYFKHKNKFQYMYSCKISFLPPQVLLFIAIISSAVVLANAKSMKNKGKLHFEIFIIVVYILDWHHVCQSHDSMSV